MLARYARTLRGNALHSGSAASVTFMPIEGPVTFEQRGNRATLRELRVVRTDRGVCAATEDGRVKIDLIEHLLAAMGGFRIRHNILVSVEGDELPLLDGGARQYVRALVGTGGRDLGETPLVVMKDAELRHENSVYRFTRAGDVSLAVDVEFRAPVGRQQAESSGSPREFFERFAGARTFGWDDEIEALRMKGRARTKDFSSVLVFSSKGRVLSSTPPGEAEPARHKLLDLVGDLALYGGPPLGRIVAERPGHTATHAVVREALRAGVLEQRLD